MARVAAEALVDERDWSLVFKSGWRRRLRVKGFFAGHDTREELKEKLIRQYASEAAYASETALVVASKAPAPARGKRREKKSGLTELSLTNVRDAVVLATNLDDEDDGFRCSSTPISPYPEKKRKLSHSGAAALPRTPEQRLPVATVPEAALRMDDGSESSLDNPVIGCEVENFVVHARSQLFSFTLLPVCINGVLSGGAGCPQKVILVGTSGAERVMFKERVDMWRLILSPTLKPTFLLKTKNRVWVKLRRPDAAYEKFMGEALALAHFLNFVKKSPEASTIATEKYLRKECRMVGDKPPLDRLSRHLKVIRSFVEEDAEIESAPVLRRIFPNLFIRNASPQRDDEYALDTPGSKRKIERLPFKSENTDRKGKRYKVMAKKDAEKPKLLKASEPELLSDSDTDSVEKKGKYAGQDRKLGKVQELQFQTSRDAAEMAYQSRQVPKSSTKDVLRIMFTQDELDVEDPPLCVLCDDGGDLIYCEGPCQRHFHPTKGSGVLSSCETLGLTAKELKDMGKYYCENCKHKQQQCFICGELGSSSPTSQVPQEVQQCDVSFCKQFYHVECAAQMVSAPRTDWKSLANRILDGREKLLCPRHCCSVCGEAELSDPGMLVQCRRCPKAWHNKCLTDYAQSGELPSRTIWKHHDREFIYCRDHRIIKELLTPGRDHVRFPIV